MKKLKVLITAFAFFAFSCIFSSDVFALQATASITVNGLTITYQTSISTIKNYFGEPKLTTDSAFGGYAYTFYTDEYYDNYLYVETNSSGVICSYASIDPGYTTSGKYSYGDTYSIADTSPGGYVMYDTSNSNKVIGGLHYTSTGVKSKATFVANYESNPTKYLKGLSQQSVLMYNALMYLLGGSTELVWDEDMFYINEEFKEIRNESIRRYFLDVYGAGKTSVVFTGIFAESSVEVESSSNFLLNPCQFAFKARTTLSTNFGERDIAIFDYDYNNKILSAIVVSADVFESADEVSLTSSEVTKLAAGREKYESAISNFSSAGSSIYTTTPVTSSASGLVAGVLKDCVQQGIVDYINAIRVAGGHSELELSSAAATVAQYKSTLLSYRYSVLGLTIAHSVEQPSGVSDSYYYIAKGNGSSYAENLYWSSNSSTTTSKMMSAINSLIDEGSESTPDFGHRYNLLYKYKYVGVGMSPYVLSNEFSGTASNDEFLIAWPSEGITFMETLVTQKFRWTATFTDKYDIISGSTTVDVTCLNTGDTWSFTDEEGSYTSSVTRIYKLYTSSNRIVFADPEIVPQAGYVYEITIHNLKNTSTNATEDYTYRAVFEYADTDSYGTTVSSISIATTDEKDEYGQKYTTDLTEAEDGVYYVSIGTEEKVRAIVDDDATDVKLTWSSSDDSVTVTQNGTIIASKMLDHDVTITVTSDTTGVSASIKVRPYIQVEEIILDSTSLTLTVGDEENDHASLSVEYVPEEANTVSSDVVWQVMCTSDTSKVYDIDDSEITKYLTVTVDEDDPFSVTITANDIASSSENVFKVMVTLEDAGDTYTGSCLVEVLVPLEQIELTYSSIYSVSSTYYAWSAGLINANSSTKQTSIDFNEFYDAVGTNQVTFTTKYYPSNTTADKTITWKVTSDASGKVESDIMSLSSSSDLDGTFTINSVGTAYVWATMGDESAYMKVTITATLESIKLRSSTDSSGSSATSKTIKTDTFPIEDQVVVDYTPSVCDDAITYSSNNTSVGTVDANGVVTFYKAGTVKITAVTEEGYTSTYTYNVKLVASDLTLDVEGTTQILVLGDSVTNAAVTTPEGVSITYKTSDSSIATVNSSGKVTAVGTGTATITATLVAANSLSGAKIERSYYVKVISPVTSISTDDYVTVYLEESAPKLTVTTTPTDTTDTLTITWSSSNTSVLKINSSTGQTTAVKSGSATVTVTVVAKNELGTTTFTRTIKVTVKSVNDPDYLKGDLDRDGDVDAVDAALALDFYKYGGETSEDLLIGDMDDDGDIDATDAALILDVYKYGS